MPRASVVLSYSQNLERPDFYTQIPNPLNFKPAEERLKATVTVPPNVPASDFALDPVNAIPPSVAFSPVVMNPHFYQEEDAGAVSERAISRVLRLLPDYKEAWTTS
ncbi:hypothetical protein JR316_0007451 [Psilocybe cubensis]|uniref:Uncharacterized protein n=2 Tax=Psilocybe cubensis TaxID=181762 RepID=A0ACB8GZ45_PSICU|nr:hypothetical protein JR316_0007451 [Psilocybe cubensis]KAH9480849.1 hypothetical protein JR316_0007451 [Psilocybe cubensis]